MNIKTLTKTIILCLLLFVSFRFISTKVVRLCVVDGDSMSPTLYDGQYMLMKPSFSLTLEDIAFYDVVVFSQEIEREDGSTYTDTLIKRVVGLPGDTVEISEDGVVMVNELPINDRHASEPVQKDNRGIASKSVTVPEGCLFVLGDNRNKSIDSRVFGCVPYSQLKGKILQLY